MRLLFALAIMVSGLVATPRLAQSAPGACPPLCDTIPASAWMASGSVPLSGIYRWPHLAGLAVAVTTPRFEFESWCATPGRDTDPRDFAVAAHADVANPPGQWNLHVQVIHWRGDTVTGGRDALQSLEWARMALASCQMTAAEVSPSITTSTAMDLAAVISDGGRRVMRTYLIVDPASSSLVELALWSTVPPSVEWGGVRPDTEVFDAMAAPLCEAYLGSCR
ncbi:ATPase [Mycobacterium sp. pW049]|uniref:ATPase n=1 Tax=[Mycobacterium] bulgaricum TaxID=3238985 RepID=UPI00351BC419